MIGLAGSVSAADLVVNSNTTHSDIDTWMKSNTTVKGNNLIFNASSYELSDTILVSKAINIKSASNKKSQINFNKNKNMFNVTASGITFSDLTLNHNGKGNSKDSFALIFSNGSKSIINIKNMNFNLNNNYLVGIGGLDWKGNLSNSIFKCKGNDNFGILAGNWTGNIFKTSMTISKEGAGIFALNWFGNFSYNKLYFSGSGGVGISALNWTGNLYNSNITAVKGGGIFVNKWIGKISNAIININGVDSFGIIFNSSSKGTIYKSKIYAKKGGAVLISKNIKVISTKAVSSKYYEDISIVGPRVYAEKFNSYISPKSLIYKIKVFNSGESKSKTSYLTFYYGKYKKTVKVKALKAGRSTTVKVTIPKSFKKYKKKITTTYYNGAGKKRTSKPWIFK